MAGHSFTANGRTVFIDYPDAIDQRITVNGREWRFDFSEYGGPLWLRADGEPRACQHPNRRVWDAFQEWMDGRAAK